MSQRLTSSMQHLQERYNQVQGELESVSRQRLHELAEKERLAARLQNTLAAMPNGVVVLDVRGYVEQANPAAEEILGTSLLGKLWRDLIAECFEPRADDGFEVSLRNGKRVSLAIKDLGDEPGQLLVLTDMTTTRQLQEQLARKERLSALGKMTAALAHQIRTPLSAAMLYAENLQQDELPTHLQQRFSQRISQRLHELERQISDMLLFARGPLPCNDRLTVEELMLRWRQIAEPHIDQRTVQWRGSVLAASLRCNSEMLLGALMNLVHNALQAASDSELRINCYQRGQLLRIVVMDNGPGMNKQVLEQAAEDFFSRKQTGTGLGLMVVKAVAMAHGGRFLLQSKVGRGTRAIVELPLLVGG